MPFFYKIKNCEILEACVDNLNEQLDLIDVLVDGVF